jgi:hypothetical protein
VIKLRKMDDFGQLKIENTFKTHRNANIFFAYDHADQLNETSSQRHE